MMRFYISLFAQLLLVISTSCQSGEGNGSINYSADYIDLGNQSAALYHSADHHPKSEVGIVVMHSGVDYMNFIANSRLAERGYTVLATAPPSGDEMENKLLAIKKCVDYLKQRKDINKVVLLGHSGGATVMTAYQLLAEKGRAALDGKLYAQYSSRIDSLPQADGIMLLDANFGLSTMTLISLDPNVTEQGRGTNVVPRLNPGDPNIGYNPQGSTYTQKFIAAYNSGQAQRMNTITEIACDGLSKVNSGTADFTGNEPLVIAGAASMRFYNKLILQDTTLLSHTVGNWPLLKPDGTIVNQNIRCVRKPMRYVDATPQYSDALVTTVKGWMSSFAISVSDDFLITSDRILGVDWTSNINSPIGNIAGIAVPSLFMGMTGSYEYIASENIYNNSPSKDKTIVFADGAGHMLESDNSEYNGITEAIFDYVDDWLNTRFVH